MAYTRIKPRRGTNYEWSVVNPILDEGELGVVYPDTGVGTGLSKFKIGDGVHRYTELPWAFDGAAAAAINGGSVENFHVIQLRSGSTRNWILVNPVLEANEISYDTTVHCFKVGDGVTQWEDLPYTEAGESLENVHDYGDEDSTTISRMIESESTSTLNDILDSDTPVEYFEEVGISVTDEPEEVVSESTIEEQIEDETVPIEEENTTVTEDDPEAPEKETVPEESNTTIDEDPVFTEENTVTETVTDNTENTGEEYSEGSYEEIPDDEELL